MILILPAWSGSHFYNKTIITEFAKRPQLVADMSVCCSEEDLKPEAKNDLNWSITQDPKRCKKSETEGYRYVYLMTLGICKNLIRKVYLDGFTFFQSTVSQMCNRIKMGVWGIFLRCR